MIKRIGLVVVMICFLGGCYNYEELNSIAIISAIGIDHRDGEFRVSYQIVNSNNASNNTGYEQASVVVYDYPAKSLEESAREASLLTSKRLFASHARVVVISEEVARGYLPEVMDFIYRDPDIRNEFYVVMTKGNSPSDVLKVMTPLVNISGEDIANSLINSNEIMGINESIMFSDLLNKYLNPRCDVVIPSVEIINSRDNRGKNIGNISDSDSVNNNGDEKDIDKSEKDMEGESTENLKKSDYDANILISTMGVFRGSEFLGFLTEEESISYNFITGNLNKTLVEYECDDNKFVVLDIIKIKSGMDVLKGGKISIKIEGRASIAETHCRMDLRDEMVIERINKGLNERIEEMVKKSFYGIRDKYNSDIFGIEDMYYKKMNGYYKTVKRDWDEYFRNIEIEVESDVNLFSKGNGLGGIYEMEN